MIMQRCTRANLHTRPTVFFTIFTTACSPVQLQNTVSQQFGGRPHSARSCDRHYAPDIIYFLDTPYLLMAVKRTSILRHGNLSQDL